jgi:hypothetical protein
VDQQDGAGVKSVLGQTGRISGGRGGWAGEWVLEEEFPGLRDDPEFRSVVDG